MTSNFVYGLWLSVAIKMPYLQPFQLTFSSGTGLVNSWKSINCKHMYVHIKLCKSQNDQPPSQFWDYATVLHAQEDLTLLLHIWEFLLAEITTDYLHCEYNLEQTQQKNSYTVCYVNISLLY